MHHQGKKRLRVGINGFGRIGRAVTRLILEQDRHQIAHINDLNPDVSNLAYLLQYDTVYGKFSKKVQMNDRMLNIGDSLIKVTNQNKIGNVDWEKNEVDVIIEATGVVENEHETRELGERGKYVVVTNSSKDTDATVVFGINSNNFDINKHKTLSTSICDANACAPVLKVLNDKFGIEGGFITTLHPWLAYQNLMDGPSRSQAYPGSTHSHYALGRSSVGTLIPKPTTVVSACEKLLPELRGLLQCFSYRVPTSTVSTADMSINLKTSVSTEEIIETFENVAKQFPNVFRVTNEPLISVDYLRDEHSAIIDSRWCMLNHGTHLKMVLWYDNEWGYSSRVVDTVNLIADKWS